MRKFVFMRGVPGCGKSTFIRKHHLTEYCVSSDAIRFLAASTIMNIDGSLSVSNREDKWVWETIYTVLEMRFKKGVFTVFDATNIKTADMNTLKQLALKYNYEIYCVDLSDVPLETILKQNAERDPVAVVPEEAIHRMYARMQNAEVPQGITVIKPEEFNTIFFKKEDVSEYKAVHFIGDVHGCLDVLMKTIQEIKEDELYVFCGDYIDRGIQNAQTLEFLFSIMHKRNVIFLKGNHELHLEAWANKEKIVSNTFKNETQKELELHNISTKKAKKFCENLKDCFYADYNGKTIFACHGGIPRIPENIDILSSEQLIKGVGRYTNCEEVEQCFNDNSNGTYLVHGHRNITNEPIHPFEFVFNLEGAVEMGGVLRMVTFTEDGFTTTETVNTVFRKREETTEAVEQAIEELRGNEYITEKEFGDVSSFNFSRKAFEKGIWNKQTITARGLYIDTVKNRIVARSYEKFFRIDEIEELQLGNLKQNLKFPITVFRKENGFLGIFSSYNGEPFFATKSSISGDFNQYFKDIMYAVYGEEKIRLMNIFCNKNNCTLVFEVIDPTNDPHIVEYGSQSAVLLDVIYNTLQFKKMPYKELTEIATEAGLQVKQKVGTIETFGELKKWVKEQNNMDIGYLCSDDIEGYVLEDDKGFMCKVKTGYYNFWKYMRNIAGAVYKHGAYKKAESIDHALGKQFYEWVLAQKESGIEYDANHIIQMRQDFLNYRKKQQE